MMKSTFAIFAPCLSLLATGAAVACPVCDTGTGEQVRAGIGDGEFVKTLVAVLLPFPILLACVAMIHFGWPAWGRDRRKGRP